MKDKQRSQDIGAGVRDGILRVLLASGALGAALIAPNIIQVLDKPLLKTFDKLDKRIQEREIRRNLYYLKRMGLIKTTTEDYEHGISVTKKGRKQLAEADFDRLEIRKPKKWDKQWRLVLFDIPEKHKVGRDALTRKLKELGFYPLQRSVLVHPYPCREEIEQITATYGISRYVSYIETAHIDQQKLLMQKFSRYKL